MSKKGWIQMDRTIISFTWVALAAMAASAASPAQPGAVPDLDNRAGQPVDMASWAYAWRADREVQEKPEASFIPRRLKRLDEVYRTVASQTPETEQDKKRIEEYKKLGLLPAPKGRLFSALLWLAPVPTQRIELRWPAGDAVPPVEALEIRVYPATAGWFGVVRDEPLAAPAISADGHTLTYLNEQPDGPAKGKVIFQPTDMVAVFFDPAKAPANAKYGCPSIHLYPPSRTWSTLDLEIEWGCTEDSEQKVFDGRIEVYGGSVTSVKPLPEDKGTTTTGPDAWKSAAAAGSPRRGIAVSVLHPGRFGSRGEKPRISPLDTRITLWTKSGNLTFLPDDVNHGPILVPEHGVFIAKAGSGKTGRAFAAELAAKGPRSVLDVIRRHKEIASCEEALRQIKVPGCKEGTDLWELVPFEEPPAGAMLVQVPDERWNDAWRRATHQLRVYKGGYQQLSFEAAPMLYAADLVGAHETTAKRFDYWLNCPGTVKPDGDFVDGDGSFEYGKTMRYDIGWYHDGTHTGTWLILRTMADRCLLTGDTAWLEKNLPRMQKAADWIIRQRRQYMADVPGRDRLWAAGLLPPQVLGDTYLGKCLWLWYINSDAHAVQALQRFAEAVDAVDPALAKRYREEAEAHRQDLLRAVERELALSPVRLTRDGTYRSYMPMSIYRRGSMQGESFGIYGEADYGHGALPLFLGGGLLPADDPRLSGHLEIVEEAHLNKAVTKTRKDRGLAEEDDVFFNGIAGLPKASLVAQTHFRRDDIGPFLRFWMNNYAAFVQPGGGLTEGFQHGSGCGGTANNGPNGDLGSTAWFIEQFRNLLVWEDGGTLWLGRGTPRAWLEQGKKISVKDAPTRFGAVAYEIVSDADKGSITATIQMPARKPPQEVVLRFRHPTSAPIKGVTVNGKPWTGFNKEKETITLEGLTGSVNVTAQY